MLGGYIGGENLDAFIAELEERFAKASDLKIEKISGLQEALDGKQAEITGGASSVVSANLSSGMILISDTAGKIAVSTITLQNLKAMWERYNRLPAGVIFPWGGKIANKPSWSLLCDGSEVSRTLFAGLFDAIGTTWGEGDGSTTFNLPDFIHGGDNGNLGRFLRAATHDEQQDEDDESYVGAMQADAIRDINGYVGAAGAFVFQDISGCFNDFNQSSGLQAMVDPVSILMQHALFQQAKKTSL